MKKFLSVLRGTAENTPPVWMMRQAGRYLPEYRDVRARAGSFLDLVYNSDMACEVTIQPIRRFAFDAAIIFADILVVSHAMGVDLCFEEGEGPRLSVTQNRIDLESLIVTKKTWQPVLETIAKTKKALCTDGFETTTLIGFAGAPWTVACYMVQGHGKDRSFQMVRDLARADPEFFDALIEQITQTTLLYLEDQIQAGAEALQLFDSWAEAADHDLFDRYVIKPTKQIVRIFHEKFPKIPIIGFPRGAHAHLNAYAQTGVQGIGLGTGADLIKARAGQDPRLVLQGNLDPDTLVSGGAALNDAVDRILAATRGTPHIFNLGHGVVPSTPPEHVAQVVERVRRTAI